MKKLIALAKKYSGFTVLLMAAINRSVLLAMGFVVERGWDVEKLTAAWSHWDSLWYLKVMSAGYDTAFSSLVPTDPLCNIGIGYCQRNFAFFPIYPLLSKFVSRVAFTPVELAAIIVSNLAFMLACWLLFKLVKQIYNQKLAFYTVLALMLFPISYIFSGIMTESLFLLILIAAYYAAFNKKYLWAGILGGVLSATRNTGILFVIPLFLIYLEQNKQINWGKLNKKWILGLALVPLGLICFMIFLQWTVGDALAFIHIQAYWEKPVLDLNPALSVPFALFDFRLEGSLKIHLYNLLYFGAAIILGFWAIFKKVIPYSLSNILFWILVPLTAGTMLALPRYLSAAFPLYILIAKLINNRKLLAISYYVLSSLLLLILTVFYIRGDWITV